MEERKPRILIVDDERANINMLCEVVPEHYDISVATRGTEVQGLANRTRFDLILLDIMMPEMDGYEVCRLLKQDSRTAEIPVIFLSVSTDSDSIVRGFDAGAVDYVTKPFKEKELLARVGMHVTLREMQRELWEKNGRLKQEIIEHERAERQLREYRDQLEELVSQRTAELTASNARLQKLGAHQEAVREAERTRISRELHDELGQMLTTLKMDAAWLKKRLPEGEEPLLEKAATMLDLMDATIQTVQRISRDLRPGMLDELGLAAAIEWKTQDFQHRAEMECELVSGSDEDFDLHPDLSIVIFRIFQEVLTNIARHARATKVRVRLMRQDDRLELTVSDNGVGIGADRIEASDSFGLMGIQERLYPWRGIFKIEGAPDAGTTVTVVVPL